MNAKKGIGSTVQVINLKFKHSKPFAHYQKRTDSLKGLICPKTKEIYP
ncbi:hypothetical protein [Peribacillus simplex]|nr:hypothetical protein [Peribacillus simplex]